MKKIASFIREAIPMLRAKKIILSVITPDYFLLLAPLAYISWVTVIYLVHGPNWIMVPQDLSYNYLLNALNVLNGDPIGSLIHPALTTIWYIAAVTWGAHFLFGSGSIEIAVLTDPEFYFLFSAHGTTLLTAVSLYFMGRWTYQGLRSPLLVLVVQSFVFFAPPMSMLMNSYASPESLLLMLVVLQVGLTFRTLDGKLEDPSARQAYVIATAVIGSAAVATKFIALPILLLPFLIVPTWRSKVHYCLVLGVGIVAGLSPIALVHEHRVRFVQDMQSLSRSAISESQSRGVGDALFSYAAQITPILDNYPLFIYCLIFGLFLLIALILYAPLMRTAVLNCPWILRIFFAAQTTVLITFIFILARPKAHYLMPFAIFQGMGFVAFYMIVVRHLTALRSAETARIQLIAMLGFASFFGGVISHNVFFKYGLESLSNIRSVAFQMHSVSFDAPGNNAILTAIQASNIPTALYHALQTSRMVQWERLTNIMQPNHYNYAYDGLHAFSHQNDTVSISELQEMYDQLSFWSTSGNFGQEEWRQPIEAVWQDIRVGQYERLSKLEALALHARFDVRATLEENASRGWNISPCRIGAVCIEFSADQYDNKILSHLRFLSDPDQFRAMPTRWLLEASENGKDWQAIESFVDHRPWTVLRDIDWPPTYKRVEETKQNRVYRLNNDRFYPHYRLVFLQESMKEKLVPGQIVAYSYGGCAPHIRVIPTKTSFIGLDATGQGIDMVQGGLWEQTGTFPKVLTSEIMSMEPRQYLLGTGNDGPNGADAWSRMPRNWVLEGSKDGQRWDVLDRREAAPTWKPNETRTFTLNGAGAFSQFRLVVNETSQPGVVRIYRLRVEGKLLSVQRTQKQRALRGFGTDRFHEMATGFPVLLQSDFDQPIALSSYRLYVGPHGKESIERMPRSWRLLGSADGTNWQVVDHRAGEDWKKNGEKRMYIPTRIGVYKHLRLEVEEAVNLGSIMRLSSIGFFVLRAGPTKQTCGG